MASSQCATPVNLVGLCPIYEFEPTKASSSSKHGSSFFRVAAAAGKACKQAAKPTQPAMNTTIPTSQQTKLDVMDKNPHMFRMLNSRLRETVRYRLNQQILKEEIASFLEGMKIVEVREEIKTHKLVIADGNPSWFGSSFFEVTKNMFSSDVVGDDGSTECTAETADSLWSPGSWATSHTRSTPSTHGRKPSWGTLSPIRRIGCSTPGRKSFTSMFTEKATSQQKNFLSIPSIEKQQEALSCPPPLSRKTYSGPSFDDSDDCTASTASSQDADELLSVSFRSVSLCSHDDA